MLLVGSMVYNRIVGWLKDRIKKHIEGRGIALISGYVPKMRLVSTEACQRNLSARMAGLQAESLAQEFPYKIVVYYLCHDDGDCSICPNGGIVQSFRNKHRV